MSLVPEGGDGLTVLALNAGSSSLKFGCFRVAGVRTVPMLSGEIDFGVDGGRLTVCKGHGSEPRVQVNSARAPDEAMDCIRGLLSGQGDVPLAIGHRIVHGGPGLRQHALIDAGVEAQLQAAAVFAPLHVPAALALLHAAQACFPEAAQVACLDTAFHVGLPAIARTLPLPRALRELGIERFGFHGLSCESIVRQLGAGLPSRLVIAHLGSGASVTAVRGGASVDTSMGLTPTGGVVMGTRCGDLDPGVLEYLMRTQGFDAARLGELIDRRSGLLGLSGISSDMRTLHEAAATHPEARLAIDVFCRSASQRIAAMAVALGGLDCLVFTGGIGEHDGAVRAAIVADLACLAGAQSQDACAGFAVQVMHTREEEQIALHAAAIAGARQRS